MKKFIGVFLLTVFSFNLTVKAEGKDMASVVFGTPDGVTAKMVCTDDKGQAGKTYTPDGTLLALEDCVVSIVLKDNVETEEPVADLVEITKLDGRLKDLVNTTYYSSQAMNGWSYTLDGDNTTGTYHINPPKGKYNLKKGETVEVMKFVMSIDIRAMECHVGFEPTLYQNLPKCEIIDNKYYGNDGSEIDKNRYEEECEPKCEFRNNQYYDPEGNVVDKNTFDEKCNPKCEFKNDKYYDPNGHEVDKDTYDKECNPKCKFEDDKYYDKDGHEVDKDTYDKECNPKCEFKDDKYYDPNGHEVGKDVYDKMCGPKCEMKDGKYYGQNGGEVDKDTYDKECNPKCRVENDKYYDKDGHEIDKDTYDKECNPKCRVENDKYYDKDGHEIDKDTYDKECNPKCRVENDKYYDDEGHEVTKEEWDAKCKVVENPQTGFLIPLIILGIGGIGGGLIYYITYRKKIYKL